MLAGAKVINFSQSANFQRDKLFGRELVLSCLDSKATTIARSRFVVVPIAPIKELWVVLT